MSKAIWYEIPISYKSLLTQLISDKVENDSDIRNILSYNPLIKVHPKIVARE